MAKKSYSFYPGCSSQKAASSSNYQVSVDTMCKELDIELNEIPDWNCCSASIGYAGGGELPRKRTPARPDARPSDDAQRNFTDPDSSIMMGADGFIQAYNAQLAVDDAHQVIVACGVTDQPPDHANFEPMLQRTRANLGEAPCHATGDAGYWHPEVEARARALGTEAWVATERVRHGDGGFTQHTLSGSDDEGVQTFAVDFDEHAGAHAATAIGIVAIDGERTRGVVRKPT